MKRHHLKSDSDPKSRCLDSRKRLILRVAGNSEEQRMPTDSELEITESYTQ